jgi:hypothetical protein
MNEPDVIDTEQEQAERKPRRGLLGRAVGWVQRDHLRRGPVPVMGGGFGLITLANYANVPAWPGIPLTIVAAVGMYTRELNLPTRFAHPFRSGIAALTSGGWLTAATYWGPFAGPEGFPGLMGLLGAATAGIAYWAYRKDPAIEQAIAWERAKTDWHMRAPHYGLTGSHLLDWRETRLGERFELDTRGTGRRASELAGPGLEERGWSSRFGTRTLGASPSRTRCSTPPRRSPCQRSPTPASRASSVWTRRWGPRLGS